MSDEDGPTLASPPGAPREDLHEQPTKILADERQAEPSSASTDWTGFFSQQAQTVGNVPRRAGRRWRLPRACTRTCLGVAAGILTSLVLVALLASTKPAPAVGEPPKIATGRGAVPVVWVHSQPEGAEVFLCGEPTGLRAPTNVPTQPGKSCVLELRLEGYDSYRMWMPQRPTTVVAALRHTTRR